MNNSADNMTPKSKIESFLNQACQAEARGNRAEAERFFSFALYCEGLTRADVAVAKDYVQQAGHVYGDATLSPE